MNVKFFYYLIAKLENHFKAFLNTLKFIKYFKNIKHSQFIFYLSQPGHIQNIQEILNHLEESKYVIIKSFKLKIDLGQTKKLNQIYWHGTNLKLIGKKIFITPHVSFPKKLLAKKSILVNLMVSLMPLRNVFLSDAFKDQDFVFIATEYQKIDFLNLKFDNKSGVQNTKLVLAGYPKLDLVRNRVNKIQLDQKATDKTTIVFAPTHRYEGNIEVALSPTEIYSLIQNVLKLDCNLIFRPHPVFLNDYKEFISGLKSRFEVDGRFQIDESTDYTRVYTAADLLITDFSGTGLTFMWAFDKPVIFFTENNVKYLGSRILRASDLNELNALVKEFLVNKNNQFFKVSTQDIPVYNLGNSGKFISENLRIIAKNETSNNWICL